MKKTILLITKDYNLYQQISNYFVNAEIKITSNLSSKKIDIFTKNANVIIDTRTISIENLKLAIERCTDENFNFIGLLIPKSNLHLLTDLLKDNRIFYFTFPIEKNDLLAIDKIIVLVKESSELSAATTLIDPLTKTYNFQYLQRRLREELSRAKRTLSNLSLVVLSINEFNKLNEVFGEEITDKILVELADLIKNYLRANDILTRFGVDKFSIILSETHKNDALIFTKRLKETINKCSFHSNKKIHLKLNFGITGYPDDKISSSEKMISFAQKALNKARESGSNKIFLFKENILTDKNKNEKNQKKSIASLKRKLFHLNEKINQGLIDMIYGFAKTIEAKDKYTGEHVENTSKIAERIAKKLKLPPKEIENIQHAAILHDLGKIGIEEKILLKKGKLTKSEMEKVKAHPEIAAEILESIHSLRDAIPYIRHHHEHFNGTGYPSGLKGKNIPLGARIIAVADAFQALTSDRSYRKAFSVNKAIKTIRQESGTHFDPEVVNAFIKTLSKR